MRNVLLAIALFASSPAAAQPGSITGIVKNLDGTPAAGMHVAVTLLPIESRDDTSAETDTDANGTFAVAALPPGKYTVAASSPLVTGGWTEVEVKEGSAATVTITAGGESRLLSGSVSGAKAPNAHVIVGRWGSKGNTMFSVPLRDGRYAIAVPREGRYAAQALAKGVESETVLFRPQDTTRDLVLERVFKEAPVEVRSWIAKTAIPLKTVVAGSGFDDMRPIRRLVGNARLVALGEATHGTKEFFQFKHRMLEYLAANAGFDVFAIEASFPDAMAVDDYVLTGTGDPAKALRGMGFWTWDTEEVLALIKWMRAWNEDPRHERKLRFYGFDMQNPSSSVRWLQKFDPNAAPLLDRITPALRRDPAPTAEQQKNATAALDELTARLPPGDDRDAAIARHQITLIRQAINLFAAEPSMSSGIRDAAMAENIRWLLERDPARTKMVVWAHNGHVSAEKYSFAAGGNMGTHLRSMFGNDLVVFGFAFGRGSFQAVARGKKQGLIEHSVVPLDPGSLDRTLMDAGPPMFALDLRRATGTPRDWLDSPLKNRSIGALYNDENAKGYVMTIHPSRSFDALFFVRDTTAAVPAGGRKPPPPPPRPPAAAAVNLDFAKGIEGWALMSAKGGSELVATSEGCVVASCARMSRSASEAPFAAFGQRIDATPYRGKRIRFRASVRSELTSDESSARLWMRVDLAGGGMGFFDNMESRAPKSLPEWTPMEITGDVAENAEALVFGGLFIGSGIAWFDEASLEVVAAH